MFLMMKTLTWITLCAVLTGCQRPHHATEGDTAVGDSIALTLPTRESDVYNQGKTEACWIYALCACIEHEACLRGDSVVLSRQWLLSHLLEEQAMERYEILSQGGAVADGGGRGTLSARGVGPDALRLIDEYGLVPYQHERSRIGNSRVLQRRLALLVDNAVAHKMPLQGLRERMSELLPRFTVVRHSRLTHHYAEEERESFYYLSMRYTPAQFAESVMYCQQWRWYASDEGHPWGKNFALEVPDNRRYHKYANVPMPELLRMVKESLGEGHAVYWEMGRKASRQRQGGGAASDHAMAIVGMKDGRFVCLNSYGTDWGHDGCCLVTEEYFVRHTCNVGIIEITQ